VQFSPPVPHDLKAYAKQNERHQPRQHEHDDLAKPRDDGCRIAKDQIERKKRVARHWPQPSLRQGTRPGVVGI
jgi:hypothetical protein